jgi:iron complex transport system ATP-binding protein
MKAETLTVGYGELQLFKDISVQLQAGELVCFMGPNGCGKSTLIKTLAGLLSPLSGSLPKKDEKKVAVVLTDRIQSQHMTVHELITYGRYPYLGWDLKLSASDKEIISGCIDLVRIGNLIDKKINELSDGQMQMVMIARALVQDTPVMLLDEPTAHLDLNNRLEIMNLLRRLAREKNKSILLATHELDLALQTADKVWLATGQTIKIGIPEDLVLDGSFDNVFQFKGYDLKTGKVQHETWRKTSLKIVGEGPTFLWTKNAFERNGFTIEDDAKNLVEITNNGWNFEGVNFNKLEQLVDFIATKNFKP